MSDRMYGRSYSPGHDRSNKRKHDYDHDSRSAPSSRSRGDFTNSRDSSRVYAERPSSYHKHEIRSTDNPGHRDNRPPPSEGPSERAEIGSELEIKAKSTATQVNGNASEAGGASSRRSRFDRTPSDAGSAAPASMIKTDVSMPEAAKDDQTSTPVIDDKLRLRQERLALWKKKKAEEAAANGASPTRDTATPPAKKSTAPTAMKQEASKLPVNAPHKSSRDSPLRLSVGATARSNSGHLKATTFGLTQLGAKAKNALKKSHMKSNTLHAFNDVDEGGNHRSQVGKAKLSAFTADDSAEQDNVLPENESKDDDDIDPLDAFMADNSASLTKPGTGTHLAQVLNNHESDLEDASEAEEDILGMIAKKAASKKKEIATINHALQSYEPFRKDFYVEPAEVANLTEAEVDAMRLELDGISIRGKDCPKPMTNWGQCGLSAATLEQIQVLGYETPTSIQAQAIPAIMSGRDTIGVAKTGSGKTMAFLLPMFRHIKDQRPLETLEGPIAMIMTPTRELAVQIHKECKPFLKALDLRAVCVYGGPPIKDQIAEFKRGAEIVVCTPGRMIDILAANQGRVTNLLRVTYTVLDEADRMFDLGFEPQVMKILNNIRPQRQTVLFSATFPKSMEALARKVLRGSPVEITVGARSVVAPEIEQKIEIRPRDPDPNKFSRVLEILGELYNTDEDARTLIFVDRQEAADSLFSQLMRKGYPCNALHGGKDQSDRDSTISDFKAGIFPVLVATSVAARGLDVKQLKLVINYDCPNHMEDYVHRVGRTGRAGNKGTAITFVSEDQERYAFDIAKALRLSQVPVPDALKVLADSFAAKVKSGQEKGTASGFGGKGLAKFETARDQEKRMQRRLFGEEDDLGESTKDKVDDDSDDEDGAHNDRVDPEAVRAVAESGTSTATDAPIKVERVTAQMKQQAISAKLNVGTRAVDAVAAARAKVDAINNRIKTGAKPLDLANNPDAGEFRAMMEINDYPQKARWNVTNRTNIAKILESTGTSITTQGAYVKPGSSADPGVPKLYLLVEGPTEICVIDAVKELRRLLSEGAMADGDGVGSRYKVV